ncbi:MAG: Ig-like domain-containing protein, partial [Agathobacter sp.]|nr:Ig-like domain-containing protein [Agathobacter sp.]
TMKYSAGLKVDVSNYFRVDANAGERNYSVVEGPETNGCLNGSILTVNKTGRYKIKLSTLSNGHYCAGEACVWITVEKGIIQSSAAGYTGTYDQVAHGITVTVTNPTDATVSYSTDGTNYSTQNPRFTDVGVYNVLYKIERENYETVTGNATVTINAAQQDDAGQNNDSDSSNTTEEENNQNNESGSSNTEESGQNNGASSNNTEESGQNNEPIPSDIVLDEEVEEADEPEAAEEEEEFDEEDIEENSDNLDKLAKATWSKNKFKVSWGKVDTATGYDIFAVSCGKKITNKSLVKTVRGYKNTSATITKIEGKNVSTKKNYKVQIKAFKIKNGVKEYIGNSMLYSVAGTSNTTYTNAKSVKVTSKSITLKKGKTTQIKAEIVKLSKKKKLFPKKYGSALRYKSTNSDVATVNSSGKVKAKKKGTCYIYVIALNGVKTAIKITVK